MVCVCVCDVDETFSYTEIGVGSARRNKNESTDFLNFSDIKHSIFNSRYGHLQTWRFL